MSNPMAPTTLPMPALRSHRLDCSCQTVKSILTPVNGDYIGVDIDIILTLYSPTQIIRFVPGIIICKMFLNQH